MAQALAQQQANQAEWYDHLYAQHRDLWLALSTLLHLMVKGGMPFAAHRQRFDIDDPETVGVYVMDVHDAGFTLADVMADGHAVRRMLRFFPSSAELVQALRACREVREPRGTISQPVYIYDAHDGCVRVCSKGVAENRRVQWWATQTEAEVANGLRPPMKPVKPGEGSKALGETLKALDTRFALPVHERDGGHYSMTPDKRAEIEAELATVRQRIENARN